MKRELNYNNTIMTCNVNSTPRSDISPSYYRIKLKNGSGITILNRRLAFEVFRRVCWLQNNQHLRMTQIFNDNLARIGEKAHKDLQKIRYKGNNFVEYFNTGTQTTLLWLKMGYQGKLHKRCLDGSLKEIYFYKKHKPTDFKGFKKIRDKVTNKK